MLEGISSLPSFMKGELSFTDLAIGKVPADMFLALMRELKLKPNLNEPAFGSDSMLRTCVIRKTSPAIKESGYERGSKNTVTSDDLKSLNRRIAAYLDRFPHSEEVVLGMLYYLCCRLAYAGVRDDFSLIVQLAAKCLLPTSFDNKIDPELKRVFNAIGLSSITNKKIVFDGNQHEYHAVRVTERFPMDMQSNPSLNGSFRLNIISSAVAAAKKEVFETYEENYDLKVDRAFYYLNQRLRMAMPNEDALRIIANFKTIFSQVDFFDYERKIN